jgi:hypothetical protein
MDPYWRYAVELYPFEKRRIPIARFVCRRKRRTFSPLPYQLIPYVQYTVCAVVGTILTVLELRQRGQQGFHGASVEADPDSSVTPWLISCWVAVVLKGLRRQHPILSRLYDLTGVRSGAGTASFDIELKGYLIGFGLSPPPGGTVALVAVVQNFSRLTGEFLFGTASQLRSSSSV